MIVPEFNANVIDEHLVSRPWTPALIFTGHVFQAKTSSDHLKELIDPLLKDLEKALGVLIEF